MVLEIGAQAPRNSAAAHKYANWWRAEPIESKNQEQRLATILVKSDDTDAKLSLELLKKADIDFSDLSAMVLEDFAQLGLKDEAEYMMRSFKRLPTQNLSFQGICENPDAKAYNQLIFNEAFKNLNDLHIALIETCLNLRMNTPADMIVGEKNFASKFLVETLNELYGAAGVLQKELRQFGVEDDVKQPVSSKSWSQHLLKWGATTLGITLLTYFIFKRYN